jgi:hypothetical protein
MTKDDIIGMARQAGFSDASQLELNVEWTCVASEIEAFAKLVAEHHHKHKMTNEQFVNAELFRNQRNALMRYMQVMIERSDWHGVSDVANDLRVLEAENREFLDYVR